MRRSSPGKRVGLTIDRLEIERVQVGSAQPEASGQLGRDGAPGRIEDPHAGLSRVLWPADRKPVLDFLGVKAIARLWLYDNVLFPWANDAEAGEFEWPWRPIQTSSSVRPCAWRIANFLSILEFAMHSFPHL